MFRISCRMVAAVAIALGSLSVTAQAQWGTLEGQFVLDGAVPTLEPLVAKGAAGVKDAAVCAKNGVPDESLVVNPDNKGIQNIVVYLRKAPSKIHPDLAEVPEGKAVLDQLGCQFIPHVSFARAGQTIQCKNSDGAGHNVHTYPFSNNAENFILAPLDTTGKDIVMKLGESRPVKLGCDIHTYMVGWCVVLDHPYAAVTDADGKFRIENLPVGKHSFIVWHEEAGYIEKKWDVTIKDGDNSEDAVKVKAADFK
ncbi:MAG: hypothetical protein KDA69_11940 [Planctomycetaceae bacterium]|nr:hypothetical protein [Planctomycetaceae bacterium]